MCSNDELVPKIWNLAHTCLFKAWDVKQRCKVQTSAQTNVYFTNKINV
jgi:hypothetical protein